jgi:hypothetical protein
MNSYPPVTDLTASTRPGFTGDDIQQPEGLVV